MNGRLGWAANGDVDLPQTTCLVEPRIAASISHERSACVSRRRCHRSPANGGLGWAADGGRRSPANGGLVWAANGSVNLLRTMCLGEPQMAASISRERSAWVSRRRRLRSPANGGLGWAADGGKLEGLVAFPPKSHADLQWASRDDKRRLPCRGQTNKQEQNKRLSKTENKITWVGATYCWVWSSVKVQTTGRNEEHWDEE